MHDVVAVVVARMHLQIEVPPEVQALRVHGLSVFSAEWRKVAIVEIKQGIEAGALPICAWHPDTRPVRVGIDAMQMLSLLHVRALFASHGLRPARLQHVDLPSLMKREPHRVRFCVKQIEFSTWLRAQERRGEWPCFANRAVRPRGRPNVIIQTIPAIRAIVEDGDWSGRLPINLARLGQGSRRHRCGLQQHSQWSGRFAPGNERPSPSTHTKAPPRL